MKTLLLHSWSVWLLGLSSLVAYGPVQAEASAEQQRLRLRSLASSCAHCHGTDGHAVEGEALVRLAGMERDQLLNRLLEFRSGSRPATIMHQITKGYSQEQLEAVAGYFSAQK
ncbi:cytochrome c [Leptothrix ochracea]|uniref:c-type cytochrome n=1 Tax=Leptothrix ochracea TaxID=735331 RepID=UPI0034E2C284